MKRNPRLRPHLLLVAILALHASTDVSAEERLQFNRDIRPLLSDKCFFCHGPDAQKREADLRLDQREVAVKAGAIVPGDAAASHLIQRILSDDPEERMPPAASKLGAFKPEEIARLRQWIAEGAEYEDHWSFVPLREVEIPPPTGTGEAIVNHPIDRLVRERLAKRGVAPQPEADRATLIRRLSFDITGLPPTPAEVDAFVNDQAPDAYERLVDRLLQADAYGERMAVDWLDVARYADSYGFQVDREREMWPWRDWVIRAFNQNLPFDQFITWQIAGDLLPNATDEQVLATAFNRLHQQEAEGGSVEEEYRVEYVCDRVQTFATAFLGLTFECARCHNHKYDPITQRDYYQLFAMFQNIDEAGLYSYFTPSPPTPTLWLTDDATRKRISETAEQAKQAESRLAELHAAQVDAFKSWLTQANAEQVMAEALNRNQVASYSFEQIEKNQLTNAAQADKPASVRGENRLVEGKVGMGMEFTGDDPVDLPLGNFPRQQPFSVSLWLKTPDKKDRAVVFHRSRAWTDAASRGYELLIEDGRLKWSLIHFWPGNAISIAAREPLKLDTWTHVVVTYDGSSRADGLAMFVDGKRTDVTVVRDHLTKEITGGGGDNIALAERFRDRGFRGGMIDEFRVFERQVSLLEALALYDPSAALADWNGTHPEGKDDPRYAVYLALMDAAWQSQLAELRKAREAAYQVADGVRELMVMREMAQPKPAYVLVRGHYAQPSDAVTAGTPEALLPMPEGAPRNRLGLAQWLTDRRHPLTARVTVNRLWQSLFGFGLVKTSEDFGSQGARPVYPEVLDWLSLQLIDSGWNYKQLVKTIVMSQTYRQRSVADPQAMADDPENDALARGPRFRLPAEMVRDQALAASGLLARQIGGAPVRPYELQEAFKPADPSGGDSIYRRSIYTLWRRTGPPPALVAFDAPRRGVCIAKRERTDSPLQALILLNGIQFVEAARVLGIAVHRECGGDVDRMIEQASLRCLSRRPDGRESEILRTLYREQLKHFQEHPEAAEELLQVGSAPRDASVPSAEAAAATVLAQALLNHDFCVVKR